MSENLLPACGPQARDEDRRRWAIIWFNQLLRFHAVEDRAKWRFGQDQVIAYLVSQRNAGMPAWKRLKIVEGLMFYAEMKPGVARESLASMRHKLEEAGIKVSGTFCVKSIDSVPDTFSGHHLFRSPVEKVLMSLSFHRD